MEKLLATGTFLQVTLLRALGLANTEERQDSGALIPTVTRLEHGEVLMILTQEPLRKTPMTQLSSSTLPQKMKMRPMNTLQPLKAKTAVIQMLLDTGSNALMDFTVNNKRQHQALVAIISV